jgi:hypothetical protein
MRNTKESHPDFASLDKALALVSSVAMDINEAIKRNPSICLSQ